MGKDGTQLLLTAAEMRDHEQASIKSGRVTGHKLMERAGEGAVDAVLAEWPFLAEGPQRAVVLCGPGNNGGDGFVVARLLHARGWSVEVFLHGDAARLPPDAAVNLRRWEELGAVLPLDTRSPVFQCDLLVDALFGTGLTRPLGLPALTLAIGEGLAKGDIGHVVSLDMPSGFCADSGRWLGEGARMPSLLVVTFHGAKVGHWLDPDPPPLRVVDIGLPPHHPERRVSLIDGPFFHLAKAPMNRDAPANKFTHGHALVLAGGPGRGGAARLAARAALRVGAGLVTVACPPGALSENAARLDAIMLREVADGASLTDMLADTRINALCLGPGLGLDARAAGLVAAALASGRRTVLDADALTLIARDPGLFALLHKDCILTPHDGEFARLFPGIAARLDAPATTGPAFSKLDAARAAADSSRAVVLLKGPVTVIAAPGGDAAISAATGTRAAPWLATAGSGDVLAGLAAGLLARRGGPFNAACTAAWLHVEAALAFGPGLIAEDLPEELPKLLRRSD